PSHTSTSSSSLSYQNLARGNKGVSIQLATRKDKRHPPSGDSCNKRMTHFANPSHPGQGGGSHPAPSPRFPEESLTDGKINTLGNWEQAQAYLDFQLPSGHFS